MAVRRRVAQPWEEEECLEYYGMLSLHRLFEVVGSQLSAADVAVLAFLLDETKPYPPSSPAGPETAPLEVLAPRRTPYNGVELLLELEHRGLCHEGNFRHLLELLRVLTRHDLLPYVTLKRPRTVSPERYTYGPAVSSAEHPVGSCLDAASADPRQDPWETGCVSGKRKRASRGRTLARRRAGAKHPATPPQDSPAPTKVTCDIRLRVRAEYCEHEAVLRQNVASARQHRLERALDVFSQASTVLKARDLGSIICDIKFSELSYLDAFWSDYMSGALLEALKGVFLTESLREAVGREAIRLLVSVDEDDYDAGRRLLLQGLVPQ
ncbi:DNA-binding death effector domain-containing protein 2 isoform X2 [Alligator mississippiensis]|uniref:DNA-binding death effector domain-containing protein 2 isoform X2 n=1 Tax=Alligator mississippiensis TaxID=8496 RepID=UPI0003D0AA80|nr:DNA-binding death effector domain-containing protein 2 isoform X2 [Alligator mississippiensis]